MNTPSTIRVFAWAMLLCGSVAALGAVVVYVFPWHDNTPQVHTTDSLKSFSSCTALGSYLEQAAQAQSYGYEDRIGLGLQGVSAPKALKSESANEYSGTNIQVAGVDEPDLVKTDGTYLYIVNSTALTIARASNNSAPELASRTTLSIVPQEMFLDGDRLVIFGQKAWSLEKTIGIQPDSYMPPSGSLFVVQVWDVANRNTPTRITSYEFEGSYVTARLIDHTVHLVLTSYPQYDVRAFTDDTLMPMYREDSEQGQANALTPVARCIDVLYPPAVLPEQYLIIGSLALATKDPTLTKNVVLGSGQNVYASLDRLYVAGTVYDARSPELMFGPDHEQFEETAVEVFTFEKNGTVFDQEFRVPGHILNQFSMDEYENNFRIATTKGRLSRSGGGTSNNVYIFNDQYDRIGALEDLAPGESIYSARFMGDRAYLVTFQKVDPLFALDLRDPTNPRILGKLKIPGYSDYLHPYDDTHIIGIGKDAIPAEEGDFSWYQGLKMALFDVSDPANPTQLHSIIVGDRGTDSYALYNHKAFLFDRSRNLLVVPILLAEIPEAQKAELEDATAYGNFTYQGAFVYTLSIEEGFQERGRITHVTDDAALQKSGYYYADDGSSVQRSLFIENTLYTVSGGSVVANDLNTLVERGRLSLCEGECVQRELFGYE